MRKMNLNFSQISSGVLAPLLILAVAILGYFLVWPRYQELTAARGALKAKEAATSQRESQLNDIEQLIADMETKRNQLLLVDQALPDVPRVPELIANFDQLANQSGMVILSLEMTSFMPELSGAIEMSPLEKISDLRGVENLGIIEATIGLRGGYNGLKAFLIGLEQNMRLLDVRSLVVASVGESPSVKNFTLTIQAYYHK